MPNSVAVLERRWETRGNYGVRQLFELISAEVSYNPHAHRYDMFSDAASFRLGLSLITRSKRYQAVYVASHGDPAGLKEHGKRKTNRVQLAEIVSALQDLNTKGNIHGVYFGVCSFGQPANFQALLCPSNRTNLRWVAGYRKDIEWLESASADMLFWSGYLHSGAEPLARAICGTANVLRFMPKANTTGREGLGFGAFKWSRDRRQIEALRK